MPSKATPESILKTIQETRKIFRYTKLQKLKTHTHKKGPMNEAEDVNKLKQKKKEMANRKEDNSRSFNIQIIKAPEDRS